MSAITRTLRLVLRQDDASNNGSQPRGTAHSAARDLEKADIAQD
jgi:hypothetical protein